jgi:hypothetical protein
MMRIAPDQMAIKPCTHLLNKESVCYFSRQRIGDTYQPSVMPKNPPMIGPSTGPMKGAAEKTDMARPRSLALKRSAMTPPAFVSGLDPKAAAKNRRMSSP